MYAEKIKALRQKRGMSRQTLADMMGVSTTAVYKWENGQSQPNIDMLEKLANLFGVTLDELCDRRVEPTGGATMMNISVMTRALRRLTAEEQEKYIAVGRALFAHAFPQEDGENEAP